MKQTGLYRHWKNIYQQQAQDFRNIAIIRLIHPLLDLHKTVIDVGCGTCGMTLKLLESGFKVTSIDNSKEMLSCGKMILKEEGFDTKNVIKTDLELFSKNHIGKYKQAVCLDVIEHIKVDDRALRAIYQMLSDNGVLILSVPALSWLYGPKDEAVGHYRRYDFHRLKAQIENAGFRVKYMKYWNFIGLPLTIISNKLLRKRVPESFRYKNSLISTLINASLKNWFITIENKLLFPIGLTLFVYAEKK